MVPFIHAKHPSDHRRGLPYGNYSTKPRITRLHHRRTSSSVGGTVHYRNHGRLSVSRLKSPLRQRPRHVMSFTRHSVRRGGGHGSNRVTLPYGLHMRLLKVVRRPTYHGQRLGRRSIRGLCSPRRRVVLGFQRGFLPVFRS